jgi:hypothetical protein
MACKATEERLSRRGLLSEWQTVYIEEMTNFVLRAGKPATVLGKVQFPKGHPVDSMVVRVALALVDGPTRQKLLLRRFADAATYPAEVVLQNK